MITLHILSVSLLSQMKYDDDHVEITGAQEANVALYGLMSTLCGQTCLPNFQSNLEKRLALNNLLLFMH